MALSSSKLHRPTLYAEGAVQSLAALVVSLEGLNHHELTLRYAAAALGNLAALPDAQMVLAANPTPTPNPNPTRNPSQVRPAG